MLDIIRQGHIYNNMISNRYVLYRDFFKSQCSPLQPRPAWPQSPEPVEAGWGFSTAPRRLSLSSMVKFHEIPIWKSWKFPEKSWKFLCGNHGNSYMEIMDWADNYSPKSTLKTGFQNLESCSDWFPMKMTMAFPWGKYSAHGDNSGLFSRFFFRPPWRWQPQQDDVAFGAVATLW